MNRITHNNLIDVLFEQFPSFKEYHEFNIFDIYDESEKYFLLHIFGAYLKELIVNEEVSLATKILEFINKIFNDENIVDEARNDIGLDIFEIICVDKEAVLLARKVLTGEALKSFEDSVTTYGPNVLQSSKMTPKFKREKVDK